MNSSSLGIVGGRGHVATAAGPVGVHESARIGEQLVCVRAKVVALRLLTKMMRKNRSVCIQFNKKKNEANLDEVGGQSFASVAVVEGKSGAEAGQRHAELHARGDHLAPRVLALVYLVGEELVEEQVVQLRVRVERLLDVAQELAANDATT